MSGPRRQTLGTTDHTTGDQSSRAPAGISAPDHVPATRLGTAQENTRRQDEPTSDGQHQQQLAPRR
eukprot:970483-Alexandrium_andersonii.AAC.1